MKTIWKYELEGPHTAPALPLGAKVIHFGMQSKGVGDGGYERFGFFIWVEFDMVDSPPAPAEARLLSVFPTGEALPAIDGFEFHHVQTIQVKHAGPEIVWHLYEQVPVPTHNPNDPY